MNQKLNPSWSRLKKEKIEEAIKLLETNGFFVASIYSLTYVVATALQDFDESVYDCSEHHYTSTAESFLRKEKWVK